MKRFSRAALLLLAGGLLALPAQVQALNGPHAGFGTNTITCSNCHIPHASGGARLWVEVPSGVAGTNWGDNKIGQLCYSCHDGTASGASNLYQPLYRNDGSHGPMHASIPTLPDYSATAAATAGAATMNASTLPYAGASSLLTQGSGGGRALQCTSCHFVHDNTDLVRPYLRVGTSNTTRSDLCIRCHKRGDTNTNALKGNNNNVLPAAGYKTAISLHPIKVSAVTQSEGAYLLANVNAALGLALTDASGWILGGKTADGTLTGNIDCETCHAVHGTRSAAPVDEFRLAIDNYASGYTSSPLCYGCHRTPVVIGRADHPIDSNSGAYTVGFPAAGGPGQDAANVAWPSGANATNPQVVCSSCHDMHGGLPASVATNQGNTLTSRLRRQSGNATDWCLSCHANASPQNHHSHKANLISGVNGAPFTSLISCGDCHGTDEGATAHQSTGSFFATRIYTAGQGNHATNPRWCNFCHNINPTDLEGTIPGVAASPLATGAIGASPYYVQSHGGKFPAGNGFDRGEGSHVLGWDGSFLKGTTTTTFPMTDAWPNAFNPRGGSLDNRADNLSRWGSTNAGDMVCESCHNIIGNVGYKATAFNGTEGWKVNLLLEAYNDDGAGNRGGTDGGAVGSRLCMGCHYAATQFTTGPGGTHQITGEAISAAVDNSRSTTTLMTSSGTYANASGSPNSASYPNTNAMDCDSCHRPHDASDGGTIGTATSGGYTTAFTKGVDWILEASGASGAYSPTLCVNCHNY